MRSRWLVAVPSALFVASTMLGCGDDATAIDLPGAAGQAGSAGKATGGSSGAGGGSAGKAGASGASGKGGAAGSGGKAGAAGSAGKGGAAGAAGKGGAAGAAGAGGAAGKAGAGGAAGKAGAGGAAGASGKGGAAGAGGLGGAGQGGSSGNGGSVQGGAGQGGNGGAVVDSPVASVSATSLDFGLVDCGGAAPSSQTITVTNTGTGSLTVSAAISGSGTFGISGDASATIAAGQGFTFTVSAGAVPASATAGSIDQGTLLLTTNDPTNGSINVPVSLTPQGATLVLAAQTIAFGDISVGSASAPTAVSLVNTGNVAATVTVDAPSDGQFALAPGGSALVAPGQAFAGLAATFTPTQAAASSGSSSISIAAGVAVCGASATSLAYTGAGILGQVAVSGDLDFGNNPCGGAAAAAQTVTVTNSGNASFTFNAALTGGASSPYDISPASATVPAGGSVSVTVTPKPIPFPSPVPGNYADTLTIVTAGIPNDAPHIVNLKQGASGAIVAFDTSSILFDTAVGSTQNSAFKLVNTGNAPANVTLTVDDPTFGVAPGTAITVSGGDSQGATASFSPNDITPKTGKLSAASSDVLCQPLPAPINLTGTGKNGGVSIDSTTLDFGAVNCGATASAKSFTLTNTGNAPLTYGTSLGKSPSTYVVSPASGTVAPGASQTITVTPDAIPQTSSTAPDAFGDVLTLVTDVFGESAKTIKLSETARGVVLGFTQPSLDFGKIPATSTAKQSTKIENTGNAPASVTFSSNNLTFSTDPVTQSVAAGTQASFDVAFAPAGSTTDQIGVITAAIGAGDVLCAPLPAGLSVKGTGTNGQVAFSPAALDFGLVNCGTTAGAQQITFTNTGNGDYTITPSLSAGAPYKLTVTPAGGLVAAGGTAVITVTPNAIPSTSAVPGNYGATLSVTTNVPGDTKHDFALTEGARGSILSISPATFAFGNVPVNTQKAIQFAVANAGNAPATVGFTNPNTIFAFDQGVLVPGGGSAQPSTRFTPSAVQGYNDTAKLTVSNTVLCQPLPANTQAIVLSGTGTAVTAVGVAPSSLAFGAVGCGTAANAKTVVVTNGTVNPITFNAAFNFGVSYTVDQPTGTIPGNGSVTLTVIPAAVPVPSTPGTTYNDTLTITTSAPSDTAHNVAITQQGVGGILNFLASNGVTIAALTVPGANPGFANFNVRNTGNTAIGFNLVQTNGAAFQFFTDTGLSVAGGQTYGDGVFYIGPLPVPVPKPKSTVSFQVTSGNVCTANPTLQLIAQ